jgi:hypothetical protein
MIQVRRANQNPRKDIIGKNIVTDKEDRKAMEQRFREECKSSAKFLDKEQT